VITSSFTTAFTYAGTGSTSLEAGANGFEATWTAWAGRGLDVRVLRDIPTTAVRSVPECLQTHPTQPLDCSRPRTDALAPDAATTAFQQLSSPRIHLIDLSSFFCDKSTCYTAIGGAVVYWDANHLSAQYSRSLAPFLLGKLT
jgi:hypothetical protein